MTGTINLNLQAWSYLFLSALCISALSLCFAGRLPFKWNVSWFSWSLTFLLKWLVTNRKKSPFSCFTAVAIYMVWNASIAATNVFIHLTHHNKKVGLRSFNLDFFQCKKFNQWNKPLKSLSNNIIIQFIFSSLHLIKDPMHPMTPMSVSLCDLKFLYSQC